MLDRAGGMRGQLNLEPPGRDKDLLRSAHNVPEKGWEMSVPLGGLPDCAGNTSDATTASCESVLCPAHACVPSLSEEVRWMLTVEDLRGSGTSRVQRIPLEDPHSGSLCLSYLALS